MSSSSGDEDVRALLGRALAGEPPLTLDRDEVFRRGRRRLRTRRLVSTGGAIAGVVAAAVGAVLLTGPIADEPAEELPPAATRTASPSGPPSVPPSSVPSPVSAHRAAALTKALLNSGVLGDRRLAGKAAFRVHGDAYELRADVLSPSAEGSLLVSVGAAAPGAPAGCAKVPDTNAGCAVRAERGIRVAVGTWKDRGTGEKRYVAFAVRPDGTSVRATASNLSDRRRGYGKPPSDKAPVVDDELLTRIVTLPALRFAG